MAFLAPLCALMVVGCGLSSSASRSADHAAAPDRTVTRTVAAPVATVTTVIERVTTPAETATTPVGATTASPATTPTTPVTHTAGPAGPTATTSSAATGLQSQIPTTSFVEAGHAPSGAAILPPGVHGSDCPGLYVTSAGAITHDDDADPSYGIYGGGLSETCRASAGLASDYLKDAGFDPGNSTIAPHDVSVDGATCGNYWFKPVRNEETPVPYVTCNLPGATVTFFDISEP